MPATVHLKTVVRPTSETPNIPQTKGNVDYNIFLQNEQLAQKFI
jgi:hypothetical protein